jgi:hypothetical protein
MKELTVDEITRRLDTLQDEIAHIIRVLEERPERAYANAEDPIAIPAAEVARLLSVKRDVVYQLHHEGVLNGFRPHPKSHLKFLLSEVRALAATMSAERRDA